MAEETANTVNPIPVLRTYPIRPDNSLNLTAAALDKLKWAIGMQCQVWVDPTNNRIIITPAETGDEVQ